MNDFVVTINKKKHSVEFIDEKTIKVNGKEFKVDFARISNYSYLMKLENQPFEVAVNKLENGRFGLLFEGWYFDAIVRTKIQESANELILSKSKLSHKVELRAPMPGLVLKIKKEVGDKVEIGDPLVILEAMKMENELRSTTSGIIKKTHVKVGDSVEKGGIIITIE